jgi:putative ABC transport system substrate-binding protein
VQRRSIIAALAVSVVAPQWLSAQLASAKIPRVGILTVADSERTSVLDAFRRGLCELGYIEGRDIILEFRFARGDSSRRSELTAELIAVPVDAIVVAAGVGASAVDPSGGVPVVVPALMDHVQRGFAVSLARPGGNITGFILVHTELNGKRLELLRTAFPQITAVTVLVNP